MLIAYVDESGDTGPVAAGGSLTYTLGCVVVDAERWHEAFDLILEIRRDMREEFGLLMRAEVKAQYLVRNSGPIRDLGISPQDRQALFRGHMAAHDEVGSRVFAVVADKRSGLSGTDCFDLAWEGLLQRLERSTRDATGALGHNSFMVVHDEGESLAIRAWTRRARRHLTAGTAFGARRQLRAPARRLVDDPVPRQSQHSYFIQLADLAAYAAFRSVVRPGTNVERVCPQDMWLELGEAVVAAVSGLRPRAAAGIVLRS